MKRRGFFKLLGAAAAAPVVAKAADPTKASTITLCEPERFRMNHEPGDVYRAEPVEWNAPFDESDYIFYSGGTPPTIDADGAVWMPVEKPRGLDSPAALQLIWEGKITR